MHLVDPKTNILEVQRELKDGSFRGHFDVHKTLVKIWERFY